MFLSSLTGEAVSWEASPPRWRVCLRLAERTLPNLMQMAYEQVFKGSNIFDEVMAKSIVRTQHWPIDYPDRGELWLKLCEGHSKGGVPDDFYQGTVKESLGGLWPMGLPAYADPLFCEDYLLSAEGQQRAERVLFIVSVSHPFITYCPILHPVVSLLLHYLSEEQVRQLASTTACRR
ncbi:hypothetical protein V5799_032377 [Amblyomma americanum]|uniref:Uncharacterized protein n=1 Tax=Amblyomma americanum TaxID=6943 RepID=A0AAQ4DRC8_AMBAM